MAYSGDDANDEHLYKFISSTPSSLKEGTLYVADTINGKWLPLDWEQQPGEQTKDVKNPTSSWPFDEDNIHKPAVVAIRGDLIEKMNKLHLLV